MLTKRSWLLIGMSAGVCLIGGWALASYNAPDKVSDRQAAALGLTPSEFKVLDQEVRKYFDSFFPGADYPIVYTRLEELEDEPGLVVIEAKARVMMPSPTAVFGFRNGEVSVISGIEYEH